MHTHLLDFLALKVGCVCVSDLRLAQGCCREQLLYAVEQVSPCAASLDEWNSTNQYVAGLGPSESESKAKDALIIYLNSL